MRVLLVVVVATLGAAACTSSTHNSASQSFATSELAIKTVCHAYWVGSYIQGANNTQRQWVTKEQYSPADGTATGYVAELQRSSHGYRVVNCRFGRYTHG